MFSFSPTMAADSSTGILRAYYISTSTTSPNAIRMQKALQPAPFPFERWPAVIGGPALLHTHATHLERGVEPHLLSPRCTRRKLECSLSNISAWGQTGIYLSHATLMEHVLRTYERSQPNGTILILQDDATLSPSWLGTLKDRVMPALREKQAADWTRCLLVWFGAMRPVDCDDELMLCRVRPPSGPVPPDGRRYYHGLQASLLRVRAARCLLQCLSHTPIKSIDSALVNCEPRCEPGTTWALRDQRAIGSHAGGSERGRVDAGLRVATGGVRSR